MKNKLIHLKSRILKHKYLSNIEKICLRVNEPKKVENSLILIAKRKKKF